MEEDKMYFVISIIALVISIICYIRVRALNNEFESLERRTYGNIKFNSFYMLPTRSEILKAEECKKILEEYKTTFEDSEDKKV